MVNEGLQSQSTTLHIEKVTSVFFEPPMIEDADDILVSTRCSKLQIHSDFIVWVPFSDFNPCHSVHCGHNVRKDNFPSKQLQSGSV